MSAENPRSLDIRLQELRLAETFQTNFREHGMRPLSVDQAVALARQELRTHGAGYPAPRRTNPPRTR